MITFYEAGYAMPTSTFAEHFKRGETGCFLVKRVRNIKTGKRLKRPVAALGPFSSKEEAGDWAESWNEEANRRAAA